MLLAVVAMSLALQLRAAGDAQAQASCNVAYYQPVVNGASRVYNALRSASGTVTFTLTNVRGDGFDEDLQYQPAVSGGGGTVATFVQEANAYSCQGGGLFQTRHEALATYSDGSVSTVSYFDIAGPRLPAGLKAGDSWDVAFTQQAWVPDGVSTERFEDHVTAVDVEPISIAGGTFQAMRLDHNATTTPLDYEGEPHQTSWTEWLAPGVGPIKDEGQALELASLSAGPRQMSPKECADLQATIDSTTQDMNQHAAQLSHDLSQLDQLTPVAIAQLAQAVGDGSIGSDEAAVVQDGLGLLSTHLTALHSTIDGQPAQVVFDEPSQALGRALLSDETMLLEHQASLPSAATLQAPLLDLQSSMSVGAADQRIADDLQSLHRACP